ncbi:hypothetical protein N5D67_14400 [Comamonas aquatica]|uniref:hypothetical protein n=1 Tax=Comamonas aquatica TaxID=225991 RepID=UPI00244C32CC|nr:hypothetical protein [Comamonas aquatica]MDH1903492.1 hypothetical protein [Comamonas aquatica]
MRLKSLALGILSLPALTAFAADVPVPNPPPGAVNANPNYLEYKKTGNTYTWNPVGTSTPPGSGSISFPATQTVSTVEPKFTATGDLPYQHKGGAGAKVSISTGINKQALAKAASDAVKGAASVVAAGSTNPYVQVGALACMAFCAPLAQWGVDKLKANGDGTFSALVPDPSATVENSDGRLYKVKDVSPHYSYGITKSATCEAARQYLSTYGTNVQWKTWTGVLVGTSVCKITQSNGPYNNGVSWDLVISDAGVSSCPANSPIVNGVCNGEATIEKTLDRVFEDNIVNKPWNADFASIAAATIAMGIFRDGNLFTDNIDIIGPNAVPLGETTGTWPVNVLPGTTTPAPAGHTGPTEPGTVTQTSTTTAQNTFNPGSSGSSGSGSSSGPGASMTTTQQTETKTSITNNITNVTNIVNRETKTEDKPPEDNATDTPLAGIPELYKQKYPDGFSGVWNSFKTKFNQTPFVNLIHQLTPNIPSGGTCPAWTIDLSWTPGGSMGVYRLGDDYCFIWPILKIIIIITALFTARRLVFGG